MGGTGRSSVAVLAFVVLTGCSIEIPPKPAEDDTPPKPLAKADASVEAAVDVSVDAGPASLPAGASQGGPSSSDELDVSPDASPDAAVEIAQIEAPEVAKKGKKTSPRPPRIRPSWPHTCHGSNDSIRRVVQRNMGQVKHCYERQLARNPALAGRVAVKFTIAATGAVKRAKLASSSVNDKQTEDCIVNAVSRWSFSPPCGGGEVVVTYPFALSPE